MLELRDLTLRYGPVPALSDVSLDVRRGEIACLLGPSGSGKSSLLRLIAGIEHPSAGRVTIDGVEVAGPQTFVEPERRRVGMVFQDYALFPHLTVADNVAFGLRGRRPRRRRPRRLDDARTGRSSRAMPTAIRTCCRAGSGSASRWPGPWRRRRDCSSWTSRSRASTAACATRSAARRSPCCARRRRRPCIVTHDPREAVRIADRIALLRGGRLVQYGSAEELYARPATRFAAAFFSDVNELRGVCRNGRIETPLGSFPAPHLADDEACSVCIRPQHLRIAGCPTPICARVVGSEFLGDADHVTFSVPGLATPLTARTSGRARLAPGDAAYLEVHAGDVLVVAHDDL